MTHMDEHDRERISANLRTCAEILDALCEVKMALYRKQHPGLSDEDIEKMIVGEFIDMKERQWNSQKTS